MRKRKYARCAIAKAVTAFLVCVCGAAILWQGKVATVVKTEFATQANSFDYKDKIIIEQQREINALKMKLKYFGVGPARSLNQETQRRVTAMSEVGANSSCTGEEEPSEEEAVRELRLRLYSAIVILSGIVAVSVCFEKTEEYAEEKTKDHFKELMRNVFSELTVLGFIGLLMFVVTKFGKTHLDELAGNPETGLFKRSCFQHCGELICPENPFIELTETVHMVLFGTMMIFLIETAMFYYFGTQILDKVSQWEQYTVAHTVEDSKRLVVKAAQRRRKAFGKNIFDFICSCKCIEWAKKRNQFNFEKQRFEYMAIRKNFIANSNSKLCEKAKQHRLTAHFNFSLYLQYALGEQISNMVEISSSNWLALFIILSSIFLVDTALVASHHRELYTASLVICLGYVSAFLTYLVKQKLRSIELSVMPKSLGSISKVYGVSSRNDLKNPLLKKKRIRRRLSVRLQDSDFLSEMKLDEDGNPVLEHLNARDFEYEPNYKFGCDGLFDDSISYESNFKICCDIHFSKDRIIDYLRVTQVLHALYIGIFFILILPNMMAYWKRQNRGGHDNNEGAENDFQNLPTILLFCVLYMIPLVCQMYLLETILLHIIYVGNVESLTVEKHVAQCLRVIKSKRALQVLHNVSCFMSYMDDLGKACKKTFMQIPLLDNLDEEHVKAVMLSCEPAVFREGTDIIIQNTKNSRGLYIICSGECDVFIHGKKVNSIGVGEYFGEVTLVSGANATATITATSLCICMLLDRKTLMEVCPQLFQEFANRKKTLKKTDTQIKLRELAYKKHEHNDSIRDLLTLKRDTTNGTNFNHEGHINASLSNASNGGRGSAIGWLLEPGENNKYLRGSVMEIKKRKSIDSAIQFNRRLALLDTFNLINTKGDTIDEDELVNFLINLFPKESSMSAFYHLQVTLMIKTIDLDGDNIIDKYEWFELMVPIVEKEETESLAEEVFEKVFNILDYDGGGDITVSEFRSVLLKIGLNISYEEVREIINEHDDSGDGLMDLEEFVHMMKNQI